MDYLELLSKNVHPLALGNVQRVYLLVQNVAAALLMINGAKPRTEEEIQKVVTKLASEFYSHVHAISRSEAKDILGEEQVEFADDKLEVCLDALLRAYELTFKLREQYLLKEHIQNIPRFEVSYCGAILESLNRSYIFKTRGTWSQTSKMPPGIQLNLPPGSPLPLIPGLPVDFHFDLRFQDWTHNQEGE